MPYDEFKSWEFDLDTGTKRYKTWVYSSNGKDIESRFQDCKVSNIKEIPDPLKDLPPSRPVKKEQYI